MLKDNDAAFLLMSRECQELFNSESLPHHRPIRSALGECRNQNSSLINYMSHQEGSSGALNLATDGLVWLEGRSSMELMLLRLGLLIFWRRMKAMTLRPRMKMQRMPKLSHRPSLMLGQNSAMTLQLRFTRVARSVQVMFSVNWLWRRAAKVNLKRDVYYSQTKKMGTALLQKPATNMNGMMSTGMRLIRVQQFQISALNTRPREEEARVLARLIRRWMKKVQASETKLQAQQVTSTRMRVNKMSRGTQARERAMQQEKVEYRLEILSLTKITRCRLKTPTLFRVPWNTRVIEMKNRAPPMFRTCSLELVHFWQQSSALTSDWNEIDKILTFMSKGLRTSVSRLRFSSSANELQQWLSSTSSFLSAERSRALLSSSFCLAAKASLSRFTLRLQSLTRAYSSCCSMMLREMKPSLLSSFMQQSQGLVKAGTLQPSDWKCCRASSFAPWKTRLPSQSIMTLLNSLKSYELG